MKLRFMLAQSNSGAVVFSLQWKRGRIQALSIEVETKKDDTKKRVVFLCLVFSFVLCRSFVFLSRLFVFLSRLEFVLSRFVFLSRLFHRNYIIMRIITPKAIIHAPPAYNRCMFTLCPAYHANNHDKGNNTYACGVRALYAHALPCT